MIFLWCLRHDNDEPKNDFLYLLVFNYILYSYFKLRTEREIKFFLYILYNAF